MSVEVDLTAAQRRRRIAITGEAPKPKAASNGDSVQLDSWGGKPGPNAAQVSPGNRHKLKGLLKYYAKKPHPFTACVRDNRKRFGSRAERVCAVLKDLIRGTTKWRGKNNPRDKGVSPAIYASETMTEEQVLETYLDDDLVNWLLSLSPDEVISVAEDLEVDHSDDEPQPDEEEPADGETAPSDGESE